MRVPVSSVVMSVMLAVYPTASGPQGPGAVVKPPRIIFVAAPAALVRIDGEPRYQAGDGTTLQRVVNASALILRDEFGTHYLRILDGWMEAYSLDDSWAITDVPPDGADVALKQAGSTARRIDFVNGVPATGPRPRTRLIDDQMPAIYVSMTPAALIVTDGPPRFGPIPGTALTYMENASERVFREPTDQQLYMLLEGRWLRSWTTEGPWQFIAAEQLPADFAKIPPELLKTKLAGAPAPGFAISPA